MGLAGLGWARLSLAGLGAWLGLAWFCLVQFGQPVGGLVGLFGLAWLGMVWYGLVWLGFVWFRLVSFGFVWFRLVGWLVVAS